VILIVSDDLLPFWNIEKNSLILKIEKIIHFDNALSFNPLCVPTFIVLNKNKPKYKISGFKTIHELNSILKSIIIEINETKY